MSCKSALYGVNTSAQALAIGDTISFGNIVRRYGQGINLSGGNAVLSSVGYYDIDTNITFEGVAGTTTITLYKNGSAIPGATVSLTTEAASTYSVSIPALVRLTCPCETTITAVVSGATVTVSNASIIVEKL